MQIRKARLSDAPRISYLIRKNADQVLVKDYTKEQLLAWKRQQTTGSIINRFSQREVYCAFDNDKLVGTIGLEGDWLVGLYISYTRRGQGIGKTLLNYIEDIASKRGINKLQLTSTPTAYSFYIKNGYKNIKQVKLYYNGVEFIETKMEKSLSNKTQMFKLDFEQIPWKNIQPGMFEKRAVLINQEVRLLKFDPNFIEEDWCEKPHFGFVLEGNFKIDFQGKIVSYKKGDVISIQGGFQQLHKAIIEDDCVELILFNPLEIN